MVDMSIYHTNNLGVYYYNLFHHRYYTCLCSPLKYIHLYILIYFQDIDTAAVYKYAYK